MTTMDTPITKKQLITLALTGLLILGLFAAGFVWLYRGVLGNGQGEAFLAYAPFWVFPYLVVNSVYVGFFTASFAKGRGKPVWLWGIAGFALTLVFILGLPSLFLPIFPYQSPEIFAGPAIVAFLAPILAALLLVLVLFIRRKALVH